MKRLPIALLCRLLAAFAAALPLAARAQSDAASPWFQTDQGKVRLIAGQSAVDGAQSLMLGLEFALQPHWKIYWRAPGDAGYPPRLAWADSKNLAGATVEWPAPERFSVLGLETVGYSGAVVLPIVARIARPDQPLHVEAQLDYLTCNDICIPYKTTLALDLPEKGGGSAFGRLIHRYEELVPGDGKSEGITLDGAVLRAGSEPVLELRVRSARPLTAPDAFIESAESVAFGAPVTVRESGDTLLRVPVSGDWTSLAGRPIEVTLVDGARAMSAGIAPVRGPDRVDLQTLASMLGLALLGGLILNLMPCVLPVLSLKLLSALPRPGQSASRVRRGFLGTGAGVIASFLVLALVTAAFKSAGLAVGWGVQFQNPYFLVLLVAILTLFACNLWGMFEVPLPAGIAALGERAQLGNFATGAFATLLAVPCSAPFLGTALGFALGAGPFEIVAIFLALGFGMALPYFLVAALPRFASVLPRPGRWMIHLRRVLGLLLAASAAWLLFVLEGEIGLRAAVAIGALMAIVAATFAWLPDRGPRRAMLAIALVAAMLVPAAARPPAEEAPASGAWRDFDPGAIASLVRDGNVVFVDVTADWCLTCKVNERFVLEAASVRQALERPRVVAMRADFTRADPAIAAYLYRFKRYGIPFNAVYGPAAPAGKPLPELLTAGTVTRALAEAAGK